METLWVNVLSLHQDCFGRDGRGVAAGVLNALTLVSLASFHRVVDREAVDAHTHFSDGEREAKRCAQTTQ